MLKLSCFDNHMASRRDSNCFSYEPGLGACLDFGRVFSVSFCTRPPSETPTMQDANSQQQQQQQQQNQQLPSGGV